MESDEDKIIADFIGDAGRASEWRALREALTRRLNSLRAERATTTIPDAISTLDKRIAGIAEQVAVLETEEVVSQFVESSVRATLRGGTRAASGED